MNNVHQYQVNFWTLTNLIQVKSTPDMVVSVSDKPSEENISWFYYCLYGIQSLLPTGYKISHFF